MEYPKRNIQYTIAVVHSWYKLPLNPFKSEKMIWLTKRKFFLKTVTAYVTENEISSTKRLQLSYIRTDTGGLVHKNTEYPSSVSNLFQTLIHCVQQSPKPSMSIHPESITMKAHTGQIIKIQ